MALYERQQFDFLLQTAVERFVLRIAERFRGADAALKALKQDPQAEGVWLDEFVHAILDDFLLNNVDGACFILRSLAPRKIPPLPALEGSTPPSKVDFNGPNVEHFLIRLAKQLLSDLILNKSIELLEQHSGYQAV